MSHHNKAHFRNGEIPKFLSIVQDKNLAQRDDVAYARATPKVEDADEKQLRAEPQPTSPAAEVCKEEDVLVGSRESVGTGVATPETEPSVKLVQSETRAELVEGEPSGAAPGEIGAVVGHTGSRDNPNELVFSPATKALALNEVALHGRKESSLLLDGEEFDGWQGCESGEILEMMAAGDTEYREGEVMEGDEEMTAELEETLGMAMDGFRMEGFGGYDGGL